MDRGHVPCRGRTIAFERAAIAELSQRVGQVGIAVSAFGIAVAITRRCQAMGPELIASSCGVITQSRGQVAPTSGLSPAEISVVDRQGAFARRFATVEVGKLSIESGEDPILLG